MYSEPLPAEGRGVTVIPDLSIMGGRGVSISILVSEGRGGGVALSVGGWGGEVAISGPLSLLPGDDKLLCDELASGRGVASGKGVASGRGVASGKGVCD